MAAGAAIGVASIPPALTCVLPLCLAWQLEESGVVSHASLLVERRADQAIKKHVLKYLETTTPDLVVMGSAKLSKKTQKSCLGSMAATVSMMASAHVCVVKNFNFA